MAAKSKSLQVIGKHLPPFMRFPTRRGI
ncbi:LOW QUALITY PROTEIN: hypothetical protein HID58_088920 [Brassica napus]|uniref:Uncharacterized protein n=1 Tax=Brassica napus TaxID=3708 RepID=A0ABQ7XXK6_BRANA|nr:LOW QUALITY PROTEIN: hypothetical protein HID58_088920 [Brassica napus]